MEAPRELFARESQHGAPSVRAAGPVAAVLEILDEAQRLSIGERVVGFDRGLACDGRHRVVLDGLGYRDWVVQRIQETMYQVLEVRFLVEEGRHGQAVETALAERREDEPQPL